MEWWTMISPRMVGVVGLFVSSAVLSAIGDILIFHWARHSGWGWMAGGIAIWIVSLLMIGLLFKLTTYPFSVVLALLVVVHLVLNIIWDIGFLGTRLSWGETLGLILCVLAIILMQFQQNTPK